LLLTTTLDIVILAFKETKQSTHYHFPNKTGGINADDAIELLQEAFKAENAKAVILRLNSPGGSPVQSSRIYKAINRLKANASVVLTYFVAQTHAQYQLIAPHYYA
jgi:ClpP class serine protease